MTVSWFGVKVVISYWFIVLLLIIYLNAFISIKKQGKFSSKSSLALVSIVSVIFVIVSILIHEIAHGAVGHLLGKDIVEVGLTGWGGYIFFSVPLNNVEPWEQIVICLAGPMSNYLLAGIAAFFVYLFPESLGKNVIQYFFKRSIWLAHVNLYPIVNFDGGQILTGGLRFLGIKTNYTVYIVYAIDLILLYLYSLKLKKDYKHSKNRLETL